MMQKKIGHCCFATNFRKWKNDTIMKNQEMFWNILQERTPDLVKQSIKSLENFFPEVDLEDYGTTFKAKNDIMTC